MDFVLESDSDSAYSPQVPTRTRSSMTRTVSSSNSVSTATAGAGTGLKGYRDLSATTRTVSSSIKSTVNGISTTASGSVHASSYTTGNTKASSRATSSFGYASRSTHSQAGTSHTDNSSILKSDLLKAYQSLETPTRISTTKTFIATDLPGGAKTHFAVSSERSSTADVGSSRERMKLQNIIDSETNGEDTTENLFLHPITLQQQPNSPGRVKPLGGGPIITDETLEVELSGVSDAEDLLASFTTATSSSSNRAQMPKPTVEMSPRSPDGGKLLFIADSSNSEMGTPRYRSIKDELDQSKTRFRQSINELLNSSPISPSYLEKAPAEFRDLVKAGTRMAEVVLDDIETLSGDKSSIHSRDQSPIPRKLSTAELLSMDKVEAGALDQDAKSKASARLDDTPNWRIFLHRLGWALFVVFLILLTDTALHIAVSRQQAGVPILDLQPILTFFEDIYYRFSEWYPSLLRTIVPH